MDSLPEADVEALVAGFIRALDGFIEAEAHRRIRAVAATIADRPSRRLSPVERVVALANEGLSDYEISHRLGIGVMRVRTALAYARWARGGAPGKGSR